MNIDNKPTEEETKEEIKTTTTPSEFYNLSERARLICNSSPMTKVALLNKFSETLSQPRD